MTQPLSTFEIFLRNHGGPLPVAAVRANALSGLFYAEMRRKHSDWVECMHQLNRPLSFSLALLFDDGCVRGFRVNLLESDAGERAAEVWSNLAAHHAEVRLGSAQMSVTAVRPGQAPAASYGELPANNSTSTGIRLGFLSPVRLKVLGHETVLPAPRWIWDGYARSWDVYAGIPLPPEFSRWVEWQVQAVEISFRPLMPISQKITNGKAPLARWNSALFVIRGMCPIHAYRIICAPGMR